MSKSQNALRWSVMAALAGVLMWQSAGVTLGAAFLWSILFCLLFTAAVFATIFLLAPDGWRRLERFPDLLVPLGLWAVALKLVDWLALAGIGLQTPLFAPISLGMIPLTVTVELLLRVVLNILLATWMTVLVVEAVLEDRADLRGSLARSRGRLLRLGLLLCPMWILNWLLLAAEISATVALGMGMGKGISSVLGSLGGVVIWLTLLAVLGGHFLINLLTAALLPVAVESHLGFWRTLRLAIAVSWQNRRRWWMLLLVQYVLLGAWMMVHYHNKSTGGLFSGSMSFKFSFNYWAPWLGDYAYNAQWYSKAMGWVGHEPLALVVTLWALLTGLLSIVVKLAIVERCAFPFPPKPPPAAREPVDPALAETLPGRSPNRQTPSGSGGHSQPRAAIVSRAGPLCGRLRLDPDSVGWLLGGAHSWSGKENAPMKIA